MTHEESMDLLAPLALGTLPGEERAALEAHLAGCADCRRTLAGFQGAVPALPLSVPPLRPPERVRARLMRRAWLNRRPVYAGLALAAGLLITAGLGLVVRARTSAPLLALGPDGALQADGRPVPSGGRVRLDQWLTAAGPAPADVRLSSRAALRLFPGARALVERDGKGFLVRLEEGGLLSRVRPGGGFSVRTPVASAAVRGTVFFMRVDSLEKTYACICEGRFHLEAAGLSRDLEAAHHAAVEITPAGTPPAAMRDHTDEDIAALAGYLP